MTAFTKIRTTDAELSRVQDNVDVAYSPVARAVETLPVLGASLPPWTVGSRLQGVTPLGGGFQEPSFYVDRATRLVVLGGGFTSAGGLVAGDAFLQLPRGAWPEYNRAFTVTALVGGVSTPECIGITPEGTCVVFNNLAANDSIILDGVVFRPA